MEDVKAAAIEHEIKRAANRRGREEVNDFKATPFVRPGPRFIDGNFRDVDAHHVEATLREENRVGPSTAANFQRASWREGARLDHLDEQRIGCTGVPG